MKKHNLKYLQSILLLMLIGLFVLVPDLAFADDGGEGDVFGKIFKKIITTLVDVRKIVYVIAGFGLIMFTVLAIFNKISFKHLSYICISLFLLSMMTPFIKYFSGADFEGLAYGDFSSQSSAKNSGTGSDAGKQEDCKGSDCPQDKGDENGGGSGNGSEKGSGNGSADTSTQKGCEAAGMYWDSGICYNVDPNNSDSYVVGTSPASYKSKKDCKGAGYTWYSGSCMTKSQADQQKCKSEKTNGQWNATTQKCEQSAVDKAKDFAKKAQQYASAARGAANTAKGAKQTLTNTKKGISNVGKAIGNIGSHGNGLEGLLDSFGGLGSAVAGASSSITGSATSTLNNANNAGRNWSRARGGKTGEQDYNNSRGSEWLKNTGKKVRGAGNATGSMARSGASIARSGSSGLRDVKGIGKELGF